MFCFRSTNVYGCKLDLYTGSVIGQFFSAVDLTHYIFTREDQIHQKDRENTEKMSEDIMEVLLREKNEISDIKDKLMNLYTKLETDKKELETKHERLIQICKDLNEEKQTLEELNTVLKSNVLRLYNDIASLQQKEMLLENYYTHQIEARSDTIDDQAHQIKQLHEEKELLLNRLGKIAGERLSHENERLSHENVNTAELSDADHPTKLSEVYSELYDNEWTCAFEELTGKCLLSDEKAIDLLLGIVLNAFQKCREITWKTYEVLKSVVVTLDTKHGIGNTSQNNNPETDTTDVCRKSSSTTSVQSCGSDTENTDVVAEEKKESGVQATLQLSLSVDQEKEIKTVWKQMSNAIKSQALELVRYILMSGLGVNDKDMPNVSKYLLRCVEICWRMGLQEKPLHLDIDAERKIGTEKIFDADKFRAYRKTGKKVASIHV